MRGLVFSILSFVGLGLAGIAHAEELRQIPSVDGLNITSDWVDPAACASDPGGRASIALGKGVFSIPTKDLKQVTLRESKSVSSAASGMVISINKNAGCPGAPLQAVSVDFDYNRGEITWPILMQWRTKTHPSVALFNDLQRRAKKAASTTELRRFDQIGSANQIGGCFRLPNEFFGCSTLDPAAGDRGLVTYAFSSRADQLLASGAPVSTQCRFTTMSNTLEELKTGAIKIKSIACGFIESLPCEVVFQSLFPRVPSTEAIGPKISDTRTGLRSLSNQTC